MIDIDARTVLLMTCATNLIVAYFIHSARRLPLESTARAVRYWRLGYASTAIGGLLISLHGSLPSFLTGLVGETLGIGGFTLIIAGYRAFFERPIPAWSIALGFGGLFVMGVWLGFVMPDMRARIVGISLWGLVAVTWMIVSMRPWQTAWMFGFRSRIIAAVVTALYAPVIIWCGWQAAIGPPVADPFADSPAAAATLVAIQIAAIVLSLWSVNLLAVRMAVGLRKEVQRRDRMIAVLAHDLRGPFNGLMAGSEMMQLHLRRGDRMRASGAAETVRAAAGEALALVESLLHWGRNQTGQQTLEPVRMVDAIDRSVSVMRPQIEAKGVVLAVKCEPGIHVLAEAGGIETILRNLLSNALKFSTRAGLVSVAVSVDGDRVEIRIRDTGVGMKPETLRRVQQAMKIESAAGTSGETGTGLGLTFCRDLLTSYSGSMRFDSAPDMGATVWVDLPAVDAPQGPADIDCEAA